MPLLVVAVGLSRPILGGVLRFWLRVSYCLGLVSWIMLGTQFCALRVICQSASLSVRCICHGIPIIILLQL